MDKAELERLIELYPGLTIKELTGVPNYADIEVNHTLETKCIKALPKTKSHENNKCNRVTGRDSTKH